jgi:hypothetical protein
VLKEDDSNWWQGEVNGRIGWFPSNFIEVLHVRVRASPGRRRTIRTLSPPKDRPAAAMVYLYTCMFVQICRGVVACAHTHTLARHLVLIKR